MTEPDTVPVGKPDGQTQYQEVSGKDLEGKFAFEIITGSSQPRNTEVAKQEAMQFYQLSLEPVRASGGNIEPLIQWMAPFLHMPQHMIDQIFAGHKPALMQLALAMQAMHSGTKIPPDALLELIARVVNTGLSAADMKMLQGVAAQQASAPQGMPGTNTSDQTLPA